jgi:NADPH2:quinone reductase
MRAAVTVDGGLRLVDRPVPTPGPGQLLIRVMATSVNGADIAQIAGRYPAPPDVPADIPGLDLAGEVVAVGEGARRASVGDRVMAVSGGGGWAEYCVIHESLAQPVPREMEWTRAGALPEVVVTAHDALVVQAGLRSGDRLLVTGAAGGVGVAALQIGSLWGARVTGTARQEPLRAQLQAALAQAGHEVELVAPDALGDRNFDVVLELVGGDAVADHVRRLRVGGRLQIIGLGAGGRVELDLMELMRRRARIQGSTLRARPLEQRAVAAQRVVEEVLPHASRLTMPVTAEYPLEEIEAAVARFRQGSKLGKVVVRIG